MSKKKKEYCLYAGIDFRSINAQTRCIDYVISLSLFLFDESLKIQFLKMSNSSFKDAEYEFIIMRLVCLQKLIHQSFSAEENLLLDYFLSEDGP